MREISLLLLILSGFCSFGQDNYNKTIDKALSEYNYKKMDSIARVLGYKKGDTIRIQTTFKVDYKGKTFDISATAEHPILIEQGIKLIKRLPVLKFKVKLEKGQHFMFNLPISYILPKE